MSKQVSLERSIILPIGLLSGSIGLLYACWHPKTSLRNTVGVTFQELAPKSASNVGLLLLTKEILPTIRAAARAGARMTFAAQQRYFTSMVIVKGGAAMRHPIGNVMVIPVLLVMAAWVMSPSVYAVETTTSGQNNEMTVAPSTDIKKESVQQLSSDLRDDQVVSEISKDVERPMSVPDSDSSMEMPDRRPLCGPWKNAINHVYCSPGYDVY